jgi:hypothetical protein
MPSSLRLPLPNGLIKGPASTLLVLLTSTAAYLRTLVTIVAGPLLLHAAVLHVGATMMGYILNTKITK